MRARHCQMRGTQSLGEYLDIFQPEFLHWKHTGSWPARRGLDPRGLARRRKLSPECKEGANGFFVVHIC
jgi:hypothetical protein